MSACAYPTVLHMKIVSLVVMIGSAASATTRRVSTTAALRAALDERVPEVELAPNAQFRLDDWVDPTPPNIQPGRSALHLVYDVTIAAPAGSHAILDAGASAEGCATNNASCRRVLIVAPGVTATLRRVTLTGGHTDWYGGCVRVERASALLLETSYVRACSSRSDRFEVAGGGLYVAGDGTLHLSDSTVEANEAITRTDKEAIGGGVVNFGNLTLHRSTVANNTAHSLDGMAQGGGLINSANSLHTGVALMNESAVLANTARTDGDDQEDAAAGGGVLNQGVIRLLGCSIEGNTATGKQNAQAGGFHQGHEEEGRARPTALLQRTVLRGNVVESPVNVLGAQLINMGAVVYQLPAPLGHWLGGTFECSANM